MYKLFLFDMDGVLLEHKSSYEYCQQAIECDCKWVNLRSRMTFSTMKQANERALQKMYGRGFTKNRLTELAQNAPQMKGIWEVTNAIRAHNGTAVIISGGIGTFAQALMRQYPFADYVSNELHFNGDDQPPVWEIRCGQTDKGRIARSFQTSLGISKEETFAVGDSGNDCSMFSEAGLSVAFNGNDQARAAATVSIESDDLADILPIIYGNLSNQAMKTPLDRSLPIGSYGQA